MAEKVGVTAAVEALEAEGEVGAIEREPELPLGPTRAERASIAAGYRGPGRPKGSRNKRTEETIAYLRAKGVADPLEVLGQIYSRPTEELASELGCSLVEAFDRQLAAAKDAAPYWHAKVNPNIALKADKEGFMLVIGDELPDGAGDQALEDGSDVVEIEGELVEDENCGKSRS